MSAMRTINVILSLLTTAKYLGERKLGMEAADTRDVLGSLFCGRLIRFAQNARNL